MGLDLLILGKTAMEHELQVHENIIMREVKKLQSAFDINSSRNLYEDKELIRFYEMRVFRILQ